MKNIAITTLLNSKKLKFNVRSFLIWTPTIFTSEMQHYYYKKTIASTYPYVKSMEILYYLQ